MTHLQVERAGLLFDAWDEGPYNGPIAVLLHGFPQSRACWDLVAPLLREQGIRTVAVDQRGYSPGARPLGRRAYVMPELVDDVLALIETLNAGPVHLVGHDWGAAVAWSLAASHPHVLASVTSISVPHPSAMRRAMLTSNQLRKSWYMLAFQVPGLAELVLDPRYPARRKRFIASLVKGGQDPIRAECDVDRMISPGALTAALNWYRAIPLTSPKRLGGKVDTPTLFIWGSADIALGRAAAELTARYVGAPYRFEAIEGAGHWLPEELPDTVADLIAEHIAKNNS
jgi:pimeloyl-ACP methyl ester carboxylesterase